MFRKIHWGRSHFQKFRKFRKVLPASWCMAPRPVISAPSGFLHISSGFQSMQGMQGMVLERDIPCRDPIFDADGQEIGLAMTWGVRLETPLESNPPPRHSI